MQLKNKRVLLTGASGGIGQAIASALDKRQCRLLLAGRNGEKLQQLQQSLPGDHRIVIADLNAATGRKAVIDACRKEGLDLYISAIGVMDFQFLENQANERIEQMIATNLTSPILLCRQLIPLLKKEQAAYIVNIGSIFGSIGHPGFAAYCASKFGLRGFTETLQRELADTAIKVSYLAPRATRTDFNSHAVTALNKALGNATDSPQRVADELMKLLVASSKHRYLGWPEKIFVRVNSLFPGIVHQALVKKLPTIRRYAEK